MKNINLHPKIEYSINMILSKTIKNCILLAGLFTISLQTFAQSDGAQIFKQNCTSCHVMGETKLIGPGLKGITEKRNKEWLKKWINSSSELIASGDADAIAIFQEYDKVAMTDFYFSDEDFEALYSYLENPPVEEVKVATSSEASPIDEGMKGSTQLMLIALVLLTLVFILTSVKNSLKESLGQDTETVSESTYLFLSKPLNKLFVGLFIAIVSLKFVYDAMMGVGVTTNYQPEQPIAFSHKIHAGDNGIDCNYCHSSARSSKTAGIPSANVCMNCHANITSGTITGIAEIQKIYNAIGYDPETRKYIEGYDQKPIEWVRIHNLPDLAYFNHSQHVSVGKLECQECHGPIQEMDVVKQESELTMGWCIDCHRETEVKMEGNDYYTSMHEKMKEKYAGQKITVDKMGGLECGKCHY
ncbi:MAG: c-type cytochrome [Bacteroidota bacterium]|nr:c-type cytochrome [Bacteroidota bacterium]